MRREGWKACRATLPPVPRALDWQQFRQDGYALVDYIADYHSKMANRDIAVSDQMLRPGFLTSKLRGFLNQPIASSFQEVLKEFDLTVKGGMVHWQHANFLGFSPAQVSPAALLGDLLAGSMSQPGSTWTASPSAAELEVAVVDELARAMELPLEFQWSDGGGGVIQPSATESCIVSMLAAKHRALANRLSSFTSPDDRAHLSRKLVVYCSDQSHLCVERAAKVVGIGHVRRLPTTFNIAVNNFPLNLDSLKERLYEDLAFGLVPCFLVGNFGATGTCAVDPLTEMAELSQKVGMWFHIDAAYAGVVALVPEMRHMLDGVEQSDSFIVNGSKWMNMSFNCSFMFFRSAPHIEAALGVTDQRTPHVTRVAGGVDFKDYQLGMSRPFRSLKVFAALRTVGLEGIRATVRRHVLLAEYLDNRIRAHGRFECEMKPQFGVVVFRLKMSDDETNSRLCRLLGDAGYFVRPVMSRQRMFVRISLSHCALTYDDMDCLFEAIVKCISQIMPPLVERLE